MAGRSKRKPERESPVGDPDQLDIIGKRLDGGVDLFLVVGHPLDLSKATRDLFARKFREYCQYVASEEFEEEFGPPSEERVRIVLSSEWEVPEEYLNLMAEIGAEEDVQADLGVEYQ